MKKVYVVLSHTGTAPSRLVKFATKDEFTHSSIAIIPCRHYLYSFARRRMHNVFIGGFIHEDVDKFIFAKFPNSPCAVYEITVSDKGYQNIVDRLDKCNEKSKKYKYSFIGALTTKMGMKRKLKYRYTCSQFVASLLEASGDVDLRKHPSLARPMDFTKISNANLVYQGPIKNIKFSSLEGDK